MHPSVSERVQRRMSMRMTRRKFITAAGGAGVAATTGLLRLPGAATAAPATIRLLSHSSYNEDSDKAVAKIGEAFAARSEEHTSELQSQSNLVCRPLPEKKKI